MDNRDWKPGYFQTYPQAIKGLLIGLAFTAIIAAGVIWAWNHPQGFLRLFAGGGFLAAAGFCAQSARRGERVLFGAIGLACLALAVRSFWL